MKGVNSSTRQASHAGSWYDADKNILDGQLDKWLKSSQKENFNIAGIKAIIGPHAGYYYCGKTSAISYNYLKPAKNLTVFLLGPSHHAYFEGASLSSLKIYETPLGNINLNTEIIQNLSKTGKFNTTDKKTEEDEHSLEMHLPYIQKVFGKEEFKLVPIMVGQLNLSMAEEYANILIDYFNSENTIFITSSDFCHWGSRFRFNHYDRNDGEIFQSIEKLDRKGMERIEAHDPNGFFAYLQETKNTICGRNPILLLLKCIEKSKLKSTLTTKFVGYAQSSQVKDSNDSSVSYATSITFF